MGKISCFYCNRKCKGDVLKVGEKYFHKECFTCKVCHKRMENTGFFYKDESFYCLDDYSRYCAAICFSCNEKIMGEVVTALEHTFHKECFKCSICRKCFNPGDKVSMRMTDFLCIRCCAVTDKETGDHKLTDEQSILDDRQFGNGHNHLDISESHNKDSLSSTVPIRRKNLSNIDQPLSSRELSLSNNLVPPKNSPSNGRNSGDNYVTSSARSSLIMVPKHFHLPPGNSRSWLYSSSIVGSKSHPLALSANNVNHSLSNSSPGIEIGIDHNSVKKMSSYPAGYVLNGALEPSIDREDWPAPAANMTVLSERNRRKIQNPTVEALSIGDVPILRKPRSKSQYTERDGDSCQNTLRLSEVLNRSAADFSSLPRMNGDLVNVNDLPADPISASRTPSAVCEPLAPPRYDDHTETSPSRNDDYFRSSNRHLGYSMEFISSTNRPYISENSLQGRGRSLRNSNVDLQLDLNGVNDNGLRSVRAQSNVGKYTDKSRSLSRANNIVPRESESITRTKTIPYDQLRVSTLKVVRHINKSNLEAYLSDDEFFQLFQLTKPAFYQLPEWKRNDLKKRVDLF